MPPFLPVISINRSQNVRLGRGPSPSAMVPGALGKTPCAFYADLGNAEIRRDYQRHSALGAIADVGNVSMGVNSDWYRASSTGLVVSAGTTYTVSVTPQTTSLDFPYIRSRAFGTTLKVTQPDGTTAPTTNMASLTIAAPHATLPRWDRVYVDATGKLQLRTGPLAAVAPTKHVFTITPVGTPAAATFQVSFTWNGYNYTTANIAYNASGATIATALIAATGTLNAPAGVTGSASAVPPVPALGFTGAGADVSAGAATITAANFVAGPITNIAVTTNAGTASTGYTCASTTVGSGGVLPQPLGGTALPLADFYIVPAAASAAACVPLVTIPLQTF